MRKKYAHTVPTEEFRKSLRGKFRAKAAEMAEASGFYIRVTEVDGKKMIGTADMVPNRIDVRIANGKVIAS